MQRRHESHKRKTEKIIKKKYETITAELLSFQFFTSLRAKDDFIWQAFINWLKWLPNQNCRR